MISFDVVSLFTKVPVNEALEAISYRLAQDDTLKDRIELPTCQNLPSDSNIITTCYTHTLNKRLPDLICILQETHRYL